MAAQERSTTEVQELRVGTLALDTSRGKVGEVMDHVGSYVQMRPKDGGREWDARPENVQPISAAGCAEYSGG
jgi:hypothetical protein